MTKPSFSKQMNPKHLKAIRLLGYSLTIGNADHWLATSAALAILLDERELAALAFAALKALPDDTALDTVDAALFDGAGMPGVALFGYMGQAAHWADIAAPAELDAYCLATFNRMQPARQAAFLNHVQGRLAA